MQLTRAIFRVTKVADAQAPYDTIASKIYYPGLFGDTDTERNTGVVPADAAQAPFPIVIMMPGVNVGSEAYAWLATALAEAGMVVITYDWIASDLPGYISKTPGVNIINLLKDNYGNGPTSTALKPLFELIGDLLTDGVLAGLLDVGNIILGGHSAGGTMALQNVNADWWPQVKGAFAYAGHTMASTMLGYDAGTILPLAASHPLLIMGGTQDGVVAASAGRYGAEASPTLALERTFDEAVSSERNDCHLVLLAQGNHFTFCHPHDPTTGRAFLEQGAGDDAGLRVVSAELIKTFIQQYILKTDTDDGFTTALTHASIASHRTK